MPAALTPTLNPVQKEQIQSLHTEFPLDEADLFAIFEKDGAIRSAASFTQVEDAIYECFAITAADYRSQGMFSELLDMAIDELPEDTEFLFYTNGKDADCMAVLEALEAELVMEEYMMEIPLALFADACTRSDVSSKKTASEIQEPLYPQLHMTETISDNTIIWQYQNPYGTVNISVFSSYYYLYGFEIQEEFRGQGHGKTFLNQVLLDLAGRSPMPLRLQVSGDNVPALSLYKKTGFQITETLFGYLY